MAESQAMIGYGSKLEVEDAAGSGNFIELAEITSVTAPNEQTDDVDVTHMQSPGSTREFIQGLTDGGECEFELNWIPGSATDEFIKTWRQSRERRTARIVYPNAETDTFLSYVKGYARMAPLEDKLAATLTLKVAGAVS